MEKKRTTCEGKVSFVRFQVFLATEAAVLDYYSKYLGSRTSVQLLKKKRVSAAAKLSFPVSQTTVRKAEIDYK